MIQLLKNCIVKQTTDEDADEGVKDLVDITLKKMDKDHDGRLSFSDYKSAVKVVKHVIYGKPNKSTFSSESNTKQVRFFS